ncbi:FIVAR domain-containing protein [Gardnerella sp. DNF01144]|uniref:peptidase n=1 Tax=Gardnerella sp. DNF01144 TaxID=2749058 RepID=UPI003BACF402
MTTKSGKHANKIAKNAFDSAANNGVAKAVDMRKVAALSAGAAGVIAGAAIAFGATPAMAADATSTPVDTSTSANAQDLTDKKDDPNKQVDEANKKTTDSTPAPDNTPAENPASTLASTVPQGESRAAGYAANQGSAVNYEANKDRAATPAPAPKVNSEITLSKETKDTIPNMYAWGKSDNVYIEKGQNQSVTFKFAKPDGDYKISKVAIFPSDTNSISNTSMGFLEYYSDDANAHKPYSGTYEFTPNADGSAKLTMTKLYSNADMAAEKYAANRCIYVYGKGADGQEVLLYKTNVARAATLVPPKTAGSIVLRYDQKLEGSKIQEKLKEALDAPTEATGNKSVSKQIAAASTAAKVGVRNENTNKVTNTPDDPEKKILITDNQAYDTNQVNSINTVTSAQGAKVTTYKTGAQTLNTHLISDLGYKSEAIPLTVARYDTRIEKPVVDEVDPAQISQDIKDEICKKLAKLNNVTQDKVTFNDKGEVVINFDGVDAKDAPVIALKDLVIKRLKTDEYVVPTGDKATYVANPLGYSQAELARIKKSIYEANKDNPKLGLSATDYEKQITLSYITSDLTGAGDANKGRSNGLQENNISVTIKTDKALAEFTSDITKDKLTRLPDIRTDYKVELVKNKLDGRDSDEGFSWSDDKHTTLIYRYDPTKAQAFTAPEIVKLIKATPKDEKTGLRPLVGGEALDHEGTGGKARKSHMNYAIDKNGEPTTELTLGMMNGAYWIGNPQVANSDVNLGNDQSIAGKYTWDTEAGSVTVAAKQNKVFKTRLFVAPYALTYYRGIYTDPYQKNPNNTPKAINVIFVPQTNHKTSDLQTSIEGHQLAADKKTPTDSKYYNASKDKKEAYEKALDAANKLYESVKNIDESKLNEQQKADIDNATITLNKARAELDGPDTNKDGLNSSIEANGKAAEGNNPATLTQATNQFKNVSDPDFKTDDGKPDTTKNEKAKAAKKAYDEALEKAKTVTADDNATQKAVDDAKANLDKARQALNEFSTNKDKLNAALAEHGHVFTYTDDTLNKLTPEQKLANADPTYKNATDEEREAYDNALEEAMRLAKDPAASQKEVNEAIATLEAAKKALDAKATNKSLLEAQLQTSRDHNGDADDQKSVFYKNGKDPNYFADTNTKFPQGVDKEEAKQYADKYDQALAKAKEVLNNKDATQQQVNEALSQLKTAEENLHKLQSDASDLVKTLADNFTGYLLPAYFNAFNLSQSKDPALAEKAQQAAKDFKTYNDAYHAAKQLQAKFKNADPAQHPTQQEINAAKTMLEQARAVINSYATDTSKLSVAILSDVAITASPAYKNAKALADKQNPAPEEQAQVEAAKKAVEAYTKAMAKIHQAFDNQMPKDQKDGQEIPADKVPDADGDTSSANYLDGIQSHAQGQPLNKDVTDALADFNKARKALDKFKTKTDELIKSINEDATTHPSPAFKNASVHKYLGDDGNADSDKNTAARKAAGDYGQALNEAKDLLNNPNATQKDINDAKDKLDKARKALDAYNTDTTKLEKSVAAHGKEKQGETAATEGTVTSDAYRNASDPHFMKEQDGKLVPDTDKNKKAADAKKAYDKALVDAQDLLKKADPNSKTPLDAQPTQKQINDALKKLDDARTKLGTYKTDTTALNTEAEKSQADTAGASAAGKFEDSPEFKNADAEQGEDAKADVKAYKEALKKARDLVKAATEQGKKNSERPTQQQINEALDALKAAKKQIADNYKTNVTALKGVKEFAAGDFKKTPEYKNAAALKDDQNAEQEKKNAAKADVDALDENTNDSALKKAKEILDKFDENGNPNTGGRIPTQAQVDAALKTLQDAMNKVTENYKTDVKLLSNEVGDKDQDGNPVVPPFEASVPYKNALEKAKTEDAATAGTNSATVKLKAYADKLKAAQDLIAQVNSTDPNADPDKKPTQAQVDAALKTLQEAKNAIKDAFTTKVGALKKETKELKDDGGETPEADKFENSTEYKNALAKKGDSKKDIEDVQTYQAALKKANDLLALFDDDGNPKADIPAGTQIPTQQEVDEAQKALKEIKDKILANYKTNPHDLQEEVDLSKDGDNDTRDGLFDDTPEFKNADAKKDADGKDNTDMAAYKKALADAKALLDKFDRKTGKPKQGETSPTQKQLDDALDALQAAKQKITDGYKTNKTDLNTEAGKDGDFAKTPEFQNAAGSPEADAYKKALDEANKVLGDKNATQAQVDDALKKLKQAKDDITSKHKTDKNKLYQEKGNDPEFRKSIPFLIADGKDIAEYNKALNEANAVLADPNATQAQVDEALRKLQAIKQRIIDFYNSLGSGSDDDSDGGSTGANNANANANAANAVDKSMLHAEVNGALADVANGAGAAGAANGAKGSKGALVDASVIKEFNDALENARRVLADPNATQEQVEAATMRLRAARAALNAAKANKGSNLRGNMGVQTGVDSATLSAFAAVFVGLAGLGVSAKRRKHASK